MKKLNDPPVLAGLNSFSDGEIAECVSTNGLLSLWIEPSLFCNYHCEYCYSYSTSKRKDDVSIEEWIDLLEQGFNLGAKSIVIVGGEPLLYDHLDVLIYEIRKHNAIPLIFTNGTNIDYERAEMFYENGCSVLVKLDSLDAKTQNGLTHVKGSHERQLRALENLRKFPFNADKHVLRLGISSVIVSQNYEEYEQIFRYCRDEHLFPHIEPVGFEGRAMARFAQLRISNRQARMMYDRLLEIDGKEYGFSWNRYSAMPAINCKQLYYSLYVTARGFVTICNGISHSIGHIREMALVDIIKSPLIQKVRHISDYITCPPGLDIDVKECYGCRARSYNMLLDLYAEDPIWAPKDRESE